MPQFPDTLSFHIIARGTAFLEVDGRAPFQLDAGKLALVPRGIGHRVSTSPGAPFLGRADLLPQTMLGDSFSILRIGPEDAAASARPAVRRRRVRLAGRARDARGAAAASSAWTRLAASRDGGAPSRSSPASCAIPRPGGDAVATRLADVLVVETVRAWLADQADIGDRLARGTPRPAARPGDRRSASRARPPMDPVVAGSPRHDVTVGLRRPLHRRRRNVADGIRDRSSHAGGSLPACRWRDGRRRGACRSATARRRPSAALHAHHRRHAGADATRRHRRVKSRRREVSIHGNR